MLRKYLTSVHAGATKDMAREALQAARSDSGGASEAPAGGDSNDAFEVGVSPAEDRVDTVMAALSDISSIYTKLSCLPGFSEELDALTQERRKLFGKDLLDTSVGVVEVSWNKRIETVSFRLPEESLYLSQATRTRFMQTCNLSNAEKRMEGLFDELPTFIAEMERTHELAMSSMIYRTIARNIEAVKSIMYCLVVLLNINVLMVTFGEDGRDAGYGYDTLYKTAFSPGDKWLSVYTTVLLALVNMAGYVVVTVFLGLSEVPM